MDRPHDAEDFPDQVRRFMEAQGLPDPGAGVLVGLSGGVDSIVLTEVLHRLGYSVQAAHVNYHLRGAASDADEALVRVFCQERSIPCHVEHVATPAEAARLGQSIQEAARTLRYQYFEERARRLDLPWVGVAHHLDDQAETVLLHLFRGTGVEGLAGMPVVRTLQEGGTVQLMRPLLGVRRRAVEAYARARRLTWREDASNEDPRYRRSTLRSHVLPVLEDHFGEAVVENIARSAALVRGYIDGFFADTLRRLFAAAAEVGADGCGYVKLDALNDLPEIWRQRVLLEALRRWLPEAPVSETRARELVALLDASVGRRLEVPGGIVWRERDRLAFDASVRSPEDQEPVPVANPGVTRFTGGILRIEHLAEVPSELDTGTRGVIYVDREALAAPLHVRPWRAGDRFMPFGLGGHKLVSDLLTDARVPPHRRRRVWVLTAGNALLWVLGYRMDERGRVTSQTRRVAKITYKRAPSMIPPNGAV